MVTVKKKTSDEDPFVGRYVNILLYRYRLREDVTGEVMSDRVNYLFLELPNCSRARMPGASTLEKLCFALHNMHRLKEKPPGMEGELFTLLFDCAEFTKLAPKEQIKYRHDMTTARDIANQIDYARKEGMSVGMERGVLKGRREGIKKGMEKGMLKGREEEKYPSQSSFGPWGCLWRVLLWRLGCRWRS